MKGTAIDDGKVKCTKENQGEIVWPSLRRMRMIDRTT